MLTNSKKVEYYSRINLIPPHDWENIEFVLVDDAPAEPADVRDFRDLITNTCQSIAIMCDDDKDKRHELLLELHKIADTGLRGADCRIEMAQGDLKLLMNKIDLHMKARSMHAFRSYAFYIAVPLFIIGCMIYGWGYRYNPYLEITRLCLAVFWVPAGAIWGMLISFTYNMDKMNFREGNSFDIINNKPKNRIFAVIITGYVFAAMLWSNIINIGVAGTMLGDFSSGKPELAILVGFMAGFAFPRVRDIVCGVKLS